MGHQTFFIATDPVSAATSPKGRLIYGLGIGFLIYCIRRWGSYSDGVAFAVLIMNMAFARSAGPLTQPYSLAIAIRHVTRLGHRSAHSCQRPHADAIDRAGCDTQLASRTLAFDYRVHEMLGADDCINRAGV